MGHRRDIFAVGALAVAMAGLVGRGAATTSDDQAAVIEVRSVGMAVDTRSAETDAIAGRSVTLEHAPEPEPGPAPVRAAG